jgi:hypothetical protein
LFRLNGEYAVAHNDVPIYFDGAARRDNVNMNAGIPIGTGELGIGIAEGHV